MDTNKMQARLVLSLLGDNDEQIGFWYCITHITKDLLESKMYGQASYWLNYTGAHNIGDLSQRYNVLNAKADRFNESVIGLEDSLSKLPTIKYNTKTGQTLVINSRNIQVLGKLSEHSYLVLGAGPELSDGLLTRPFNIADVMNNVKFHIGEMSESRLKKMVQEGKCINTKLVSRTSDKGNTSYLAYIKGNMPDFSKL